MPARSAGLCPEQARDLLAAHGIEILWDGDLALEEAKAARVRRGLKRGELHQGLASLGGSRGKTPGRGDFLVSATRWVLIEPGCGCPG